VLFNCTVGVPKVYYYGEEAGACFMVMELLEQSIDQKFARAGKRFSQMTVLMIVD
jgi:fructosamine-3-kinase